MGQWEFVAIFVLVLIGAGVTNILQGVGLALRERDRVRRYWVHDVWSVVLLFTYLSVWFAIFGDQAEAIDFWSFIGGVLSFGVLYLLSVLSFPDFDSSREVDLHRHFMQHHRPYFGLWGLMWVLAVLEGGFEGFDDLWPMLYLGISVVGALLGSSRVHAGLAVSILLLIAADVIL